MKIIFTQIKKLTFSQGAGASVAAIVLLTGFLVCLLTWVNLNNVLMQKSQMDAQRQLQRLALTLAPSIITQDRISLTIMLNEWGQESDLYGIQIFNSNQQLLAEQGRLIADANEISQVITQDNVVIGSLRASPNYSSVQHITYRYLGLGVFATLLCSLLAGLSAWVLADYFLGYLHRFANAVESWQQTDGEALILPAAPLLPQLQRLHQAFEFCAEQQLKHQDIEQAVEQFAGNAKAHSTAARYHSCALLFIEISNLHDLQKTLTATELITILNRYYWLLVQAGKLYHGRLERYAGNGAVLLFGMHDPSQPATNTAQDALHCLYTAQLFLGLVKKEQQKNQQPFIDFRLAAHFGEVLFAPIAYLQPGRHDLVGDTLHWAAHLASMSTEQNLLASEAFYTHLQDMENVSWKQGQEVNDLHGNSQKSWWLETLPEKQQALIGRQINHISAHYQSTTEA